MAVGKLNIFFEVKLLIDIVLHNNNSNNIVIHYIVTFYSPHKCHFSVSVGKAPNVCVSRRSSCHAAASSASRQCTGNSV